MSLQFKVVKQVFGFDKDQTEKYVARSVTGEMLTFDKVCNQVSQICGIHRGIVNVVLSGLLDVMVNNLDMGHSVKLGDFGSLRPGIRAKAQLNKEDADANTIYRRRIVFTPGKMLKNFLKDVAITRAVIQDVDYTNKNKSNGGNIDGTGGNDGTGGGTGDDDFVDPGA